MNFNKVLGNKNFTIISSLLLAAYVGLINTNIMPINVLSMVNTTIGKVVILVLIAYLGDKTPTVALMLAIALCVTLSLPSNEQFYGDYIESMDQAPNAGEPVDDSSNCDGKTEEECGSDSCSWNKEESTCTANTPTNNEDDNMDSYTASNDVESFATF